MDYWTEKPNMTNSVRGIHNDGGFFAGGDASHETNTTHPFPLANWRQILILDCKIARDTGQVLDMLVLKSNNAAVVGPPAPVLACGKGIVRSSIPEPNGQHHFQWADTPRVDYHGITNEPDSTFVVTVWGDRDRNPNQIYHDTLYDR